jgi:hypothetical protein
VFENRVLRRIYEPKRQEAGEDCIMRSFITCTLHQILFGTSIKEDGMGEHITRMGEMREVKNFCQKI